MVDPDTFLTTFTSWSMTLARPICLWSRTLGLHAALTRSEVVTLAIFGQWRLWQ